MGEVVFDVIIVLSVVAGLLYIVMSMKRAREGNAKPMGALLSKRQVVLIYDGGRSESLLSIYSDGLLFEKDSGVTLFVNSARVQKITLRRNDGGGYCYLLEFMPSAMQTDSFEIETDESIDDDLAVAVAAEKLSL